MPASYCVRSQFPDKAFLNDVNPRSRATPVYINLSSRHDYFSIMEATFSVTTKMFNSVLETLLTLSVQNVSIGLVVIAGYFLGSQNNIV